MGGTTAFEISYTHVDVPAVQFVLDAAFSSDPR